MESILVFLFDKLEYVVGIGGGLGIGLYMFTRKSGSRENDLTPLYIKHKRHTESISKTSKSIL